MTLKGFDSWLSLCYVLLHFVTFCNFLLHFVNFSQKKLCHAFLNWNSLNLARVTLKLLDKFQRKFKFHKKLENKFSVKFFLIFSPFAITNFLGQAKISKCRRTQWDLWLFSWLFWLCCLKILNFTGILFEDSFQYKLWIRKKFLKNSKGKSYLKGKSWWNFLGNS